MSLDGVPRIFAFALWEMTCATQMLMFGLASRLRLS